MLATFPPMSQALLITESPDVAAAIQGSLSGTQWQLAISDDPVDLGDGIRHQPSELFLPGR